MTGPGHNDSRARFVEFVALMAMMMLLVMMESLDRLLAHYGGEELKRLVPAGE